jgi:DNA modification methylase
LKYTLLEGNSLDVLKSMESESVQCVVTSPPYYGLRDYGISGQIGLEKTPENYTNNLINIFREVKRILKDDGTLWLNLGDSYNGSGGPGSQYDTKSGKSFKGEFKKYENPNRKLDGLKPKDLIGIPWMVAFALRNDGWYLRKDIIWAKPNPMPESVKDRPTTSHEYIFLFSKNNKYYFNADAIKEKAINGDPTSPRGSRGTSPNAGRREHNLVMNRKYATNNETYKPLQYRNCRDVWNISVRPYRGAHFATFPEEIPEKCIKAGTRDNDTVLDPFSGAGTTGVVCKRLNRNYIGIELNPKYNELAKERINKIEISS